MTKSPRQRDGLDARVAVLVCGYGEVEHNDQLAEYNRRSLDLLVSKSLRIPARALPFLSRRLARRARAEYELSLIHISEPTRRRDSSRMPSSA